MYNPLVAEQTWSFWIDRGGTFTDVVARDPRGKLHVRKLLSDLPGRQWDAPIQAVRDLLGLRSEEPIPSDRIREVRLGTTLATNALLERKGARVGLLVTRGFRDLLAIGYQDRPELFDLEIRKPAPLAELVVELDERVLADGSVRTALDEAQVRRRLQEIRAAGIDSVAVLLLHAYLRPDHEATVGRLAREAGFQHVALSHRVSGEIKAVARGDTCVADGYLTPLLREYVNRLRIELGPSVRLRFMQSGGGLADAERFAGRDAVYSGPAGGVVACARIGRVAGLSRVIGFDMGGTSTDVCRYDGRFERTFERTVAGVRIQAPMLAIETVAAGGGSILGFDGQRLLVGPESAGSDPGPACYRRGGPATVTDANFVLGRIQSDLFPCCFGPRGDLGPDLAASRHALASLAREVLQASGLQRGPEETAAAYLRIACARMAAPIKEISVSRGYDVRDYALVCFGGAGAQHACAVASELGIRQIVIHPLAGVLSAHGIGLADGLMSGVHPVLQSLEPGLLDELEPHARTMEEDHSASLGAEGFPEVESRRSLDLRYQGTEAYLNLSWDGATPAGESDLRQRFEERHRALNGYSKPELPVEVANLRLESRGRTEPLPEPEAPPVEKGEIPEPIRSVPVGFESLGGSGRRRLEILPTPIYRRSELGAGARLVGPALVIEEVSTVVVEPGWTARVDRRGWFRLEADRAGAPRELIRGKRDPVLLELFGRQFASVAEQMGRTLVRVAHSTNIKERRDFSCALFDPAGRLVANAAHIPVHLGAMGETVRALLARPGEPMRPGEVWVTNDPYAGGSHLPDITVVTPTFLEGGPSFLVACRAHHADIGGISPGSMPAESTRLEQEGRLISPFRLVEAGSIREEEMAELLAGGPWPARDIPERLSDLRAQVAANAVGVGLLDEMTRRFGSRAVRDQAGHVRQGAAAAMRDALAALPDGTRQFEDRLDQGARIACVVTIRGDRARIDFAGTAPQQPDNSNAPRAVVMAAVLYVLRCLVRAPIPLNEGCLEPVEVLIPPGSMLDPGPPAAVAAGNVETSQRIVDVLLGALGLAAASQGTMNNLSFGTGSFGYYETICGGSGAGPGFSGASAVHTHMTNTRITDPEVLERRYPAVVREFSIRRGSGGAGRWPGGDGVIRALELREPARLSILSERRLLAPYGLARGEPGRPGRNRLITANGEEELPGRASRSMEPGDVVVIETPGGGGYGAPGSRGGHSSS